MLVLPESASILFGGGFGAAAAQPDAKPRSARSITCSVNSSAWSWKKACIRLCCAIAAPSTAWPTGRKTRNFWSDLGTTYETELARYAAVIHLRTPSQGNGYNHQNPLRTEDAARAAEIDAGILRVWSAHPRRTVIDSSEDFLTKVHATLGVIEALIKETS